MKIFLKFPKTPPKQFTLCEVDARLLSVEAHSVLTAMCRIGSVADKISAHNLMSAALGLITSRKYADQTHEWDDCATTDNDDPASWVRVRSRLNQRELIFRDWSLTKRLPNGVYAQNPSDVEAYIQHIDEFYEDGNRVPITLHFPSLVWQWQGLKPKETAEKYLNRSVREMLKVGNIHEVCSQPLDICSLLTPKEFAFVRERTVVWEKLLSGRLSVAPIQN